MDFILLFLENALLFSKNSDKKSIFFMEMIVF